MVRINALRRRTAKTVNRALVLGALGALIAAGSMATARADGVLSDSEVSFVQTFHDAICTTIDSYPSRGGVYGVAQALMDEGWADHNAVDIINAAVHEYCPRHWPLLVAIGRAAQAGQAGYRL